MKALTDAELEAYKTELAAGGDDKLKEGCYGLA